MNKEISEGPKTIEADELSHQQTIKIYNELIKDSRTKKIEEVYPGGDLVKSGQKFAVLDHNLKQVTYYMSYQERKIKGLRAIYQSLVWRLKTGHMPTEKIPRKVFWNYLFPIHGLMVTDRIQTDLGKGFWNNIIADAITDGLWVYFIDLNQNSIEQILSQEQLANISKRIWGKEDVNKARLVAVSGKPISLGESVSEFGIPFVID